MNGRQCRPEGASETRLETRPCTRKLVAPRTRRKFVGSFVLIFFFFALKIFDQIFVVDLFVCLGTESRA